MYDLQRPIYDFQRTLRLKDFFLEFVRLSVRWRTESGVEFAGAFMT